MFKTKKDKKNSEVNELAAREEASLRSRLKNEVEIVLMPKVKLIENSPQHKSRQTGMLIIGGGTLFLIIILSVFYYFLFYKRVSTNIDNSNPVAVQTDNQPVAQEKSPESAAAETEIKLPSINEEDVISTTTADNLVASATDANIIAETSEEAFDSDQDKLSDREEKLINSNPNSIDSDGDGYGDYSELMNLYNPAGAGKIENNSNISQFSSQAFGYSVLYPAGWSLTKVGDAEDSLVIRSADNHFLRIIAQANPSFQSIENWYQDNFGGAAPSSRVEIAPSWRGIRSEDGLIVYLTDLERNYIYILSYTPAGEDPYFRNIFEMAVKSFQI